MNDGDRIGTTGNGTSAYSSGPLVSGPNGHLSLGDYLLERGLVDEAQLAGALQHQGADGSVLLGDVLVRQGVLTEDGLAQALAEVAGVPYQQLRLDQVQSSALQAVPRDLPRRHGVVPLSIVGNTLYIACSDPFDIVAVDEIERRTSLRVQQVCVTEGDVTQALEHFYGGAGALDQLVRDSVDRHEADQQRAKSGAIVMAERATVGAEPVVRLVDEIVYQGVRRRATDVHIEPEEKLVRVRFRIDGLLHGGPLLPKKLQQTIISRLKVIAGLDIAEQRLPQEGHITFNARGQEVDLRVSCFPTVFGEKIALRILERNMTLGGLGDLGLEGGTLARLEDSIRHTKGIVLLTGPTGSGKTTTLYTMLQGLNALANNIVTLEDPVEYRIPEIRQSQINKRAGFTFAAGLRSILRQDPDVILVGEIRDPETAGLAMHAVLTGILVFSTLHTNEAAGTFPRLIDMELEPYLIGSTMISAVAERLVRKVCPHCAVSVRPDEALVSRLGLTDEPLDGDWRRGSGCRQCADSGYFGRTGIFEILMVSDRIREAIKARTDTIDVRRIAM